MAQFAEVPAEVLLDLRGAAAELQQELTVAARRVLASGRYIAGEELAAFEEEWADYCGSRYCVGVGNGLDAISLALRGLGIGVGDEVLVPSFTFIATWLAVTAVGATPIPVEPDPATANIDPERIDAALGPATKAIIPRVSCPGRCHGLGSGSSAVNYVEREVRSVRMLLRIQMDVEAGNRAIKDGSLGETLDRVMGQIEPEAAYFTAMDGKRTGLIFFDLEEASQIPAIAEPFFMGLHAAIEFLPVMTPEDVRTGLEEAAKAF